MSGSSPRGESRDSSRFARVSRTIGLLSRILCSDLAGKKPTKQSVLALSVNLMHSTPRDTLTDVMLTYESVPQSEARYPAIPPGYSSICVLIRGTLYEL